jgi:tetratricopeptide (TPR) repeat protein
MMVLDILANNNWERPVYFAVTVSPENFLNLTPYFQMDGLAYRFVPIETPDTQYGETGRIDADKLYDKMMNQFRWGNISDPKVYLDETNLRLLTHFRSNFSRLAGALNLEGKKDSAVQVLDRAFESIPVYQLSLNYMDVSFVEQYYNAGAFDKGNELAEKIFSASREELNYYLSFPKKLQSSLERELRIRMYTIDSLSRLAKAYEQTELSEKMETQIKEAFPHLLME